MFRLGEALGFPADLVHMAGVAKNGLVWLFNDASTDPVDLPLRTLATS